jgi:hypothetical protein
VPVSLPPQSDAEVTETRQPVIGRRGDWDPTVLHEKVTKVRTDRTGSPVGRLPACYRDTQICPKETR